MYTDHVISQGCNIMGRGLCHIQGHARAHMTSCDVFRHMWERNLVATDANGG